MAKAFTLSPKENSDYAFTISSTDTSVSQTIKVYKESISKKKLVACLSEEATTPKGVTNYALEGGKTYYIVVESSAKTNTTYTLTAEQDNWVFAPEGGYWQVESYSFISSINCAVGGTVFYDKLYISQTLLYACIAEIAGIKQEITSIEDAKKIMNDLGYDSDDYSITSDDVVSVVTADGLMLLGLYSVVTTATESGLVALFGTKSAAAGTVSSVGTVIYDIAIQPNLNLLNKFNGYLEKWSITNALEISYESSGEYNIYAYNTISLSSDSWHKWDDCPCIYKYNSMGDRGSVNRDIDVDFILNYTKWS
ncbi:MAG: hypothetical protein WC900_01290 [Oscillospiraceae bacterium]|jgi:hypothetical protein